MVVLGWLVAIAAAIALISVAVIFLNRFYRKSTRDIALVRFLKIKRQARPTFDIVPNLVVLTQFRLE